MKKNTKMIRRILRTELYNSFFAELVYGLSSVPAAFLSAEVVSSAADAAGKGDVKRVFVLGTGLVAVHILSGVVSALFAAQSMRKAEAGANSVRQKLYTAFLNRPLWELNSSRHGEMREKLNDDLSSACGMYSSLLPGMSVSLVSVGFYLVWLFVRAPQLAWAYLAMVPLFVVPAAVMKNSFKNSYSDCRRVEAELTDYILSGYDGFGDIRLYGIADRWISGIRRIHRDYIRIGNRAEFFSGLQDSANTTISAVLRYGAFAVAGAFVLWGDLEIGAALASAALAGSFFAAANKAAELLPGFSHAERAMERLNSWAEPICTEFGNTLSVENASVDGVLTDVTFKPKLDGITRIKGENGSGKTTLLRLAVGIIKPDGGNCRNISAEKISYLPQTEPDLGISGEELLSFVPGAADIAAEFGLSSEVLVSSVDELSGGERKKVFLSLVFARDSELIVLDEPANSLDEKGVAVLRELIRRRGKGILFVCHGTALDGLASCEVTVENGEVLVG